MDNTFYTPRVPTLGGFARGLGIRLLTLMPLISLTNVWEIATFGELSIRSIDFLFLLSWVAWAQDILLCGKIPRGVLSFLGLVLIVFLISLLGSTLLTDYQVQWPALSRFVQTLLWGGLALAFVRSDRDLKGIVISLITAGIVLSSYSLYLYYTVPNLHRIAGFFSAAGGAGFGRQASFNEVGALHALGALLSIFYLVWRAQTLRHWERILMGVGFTLNVIGMILVQSRSAFLAFTVGAVAVFLLNLNLRKLFTQLKTYRRTIFYGSTILSVATFVVMSSSYLVAVNRLLQTFIPGSNAYISAATRIALWERATNTWLDSLPDFLLGYGFKSTERLIGAVSAHNFFFNIGLWLGIIGLVPVILILVWPVIEVRKTRAVENPIMRITVITFTVAVTVSMLGNVLMDPFYGGSTFLILYASAAASLSSRSEVGGRY